MFDYSTRSGAGFPTFAGFLLTGSPAHAATAMNQVELVVGLLVAVSVLAVAAQRLQIPYPVSLVIGGLVLGFVPGLPSFTLAPDIVFILFLPPLVYDGAWFTSPRDLRTNVRPLISLALGLALATIAIIALVAHGVIGGMAWPEAFVLGTIVAPTDPIAVSAITRRLGAPQRLVALVESESLVNDAVGLVSYRIAVAAVLTGSFSIWQAGLQFALASGGGVAIGLAVGWSVAWLHRHVDHTSVEITLTLLTPFAAYLPATALGCSGVLAVMSAGLYMARRSSTLFNADLRLQAVAVWEIVVFLLNGLLFILVGLQLRGISSDVSSLPWHHVVLYTGAVCLAVVLVRPLWVYLAEFLPRLLRPWKRDCATWPAWRDSAIVSWAGMRGSASIAAALALPEMTRAGSLFPQRSLLTFLVFCVILTTLLLQGLSLPLLIRRLGISDDGAWRHEEKHARLVAARAALGRIEQFAAEEWVSNDAFSRLEAQYRDRIHQLEREEAAAGAGPRAGYLPAELRLWLEGLHAERRAVIGLRDEGLIHDLVLRRLERELDREEQRLSPSG